MCEIHDNTTAVKVNVKDYDPSHTGTLRAAWVADMNRRFKHVAKQVTKVIVEDDYFGLNNTLTINATPIANSSAKISEFLIWLRKVEDAVLLEMRYDAQYGLQSQVPWYSTYLAKAYKQGSQRAQQEMKRAGMTTILGDIAGMETMLISNPVAVEKLMMLFTRAFGDLQGITTSMDAQISRILTQGLFDGQSPITLARQINSAIIGGGESLGLDISYVNKAGNTVSYFMSGRRRAEILARTEIIRAHHKATIDEYRTWAVEGVYVLAEWATATDARVCDECKTLQGTIWTLDEIEDMIPLHPQCRCVSIPYVDLTRTKVGGQ